MKHNPLRTLLLTLGSLSLLLSSCASRTRTTTHATGNQHQTRQADSLAIRRHILVAPATLAGSHARLALPLANLAQLPPGAAYTQKTGRATLTARYRTDTLYLAATCDSLQTLVYQYEEEIRRLATTTTAEKNQTTRQTQNQTGPSPWHLGPLWLLIAFAYLGSHLLRKKK